MGLRDDAFTPASQGHGAVVWTLLADEQTLSSDLEQEWLQALPSARRDALQAWPDARARHRSLLGTRLLREGLFRLGFAAEALATLRHPKHARPTLDLPLDFSLSHAEGLVACALSTSARVGVDVERVGPVDASGFARYLSPAERAWAGTDPRRFCTVWTRKEAVVKAAGSQGLAALPRIDTSVDPFRVWFEGRTWFATALATEDDWVAHLATDVANATLQCQHVSMAALTTATSAPHLSG